MLPFNYYSLRPPAEGLTVIGEATRNAQPEIVELSFDIHSAAPTAAQALRDNAIKVMQIGQAITALGVAQQDLQAGAASVYPLHQPGLAALPHPFLPQLAPASMGAGPLSYRMGGEVAPVAGYHVISFLKLSLTDVSRLGDVVDSATRAGANVSSGFLFRLRDETSIRRGLLEAAGADAREKGEALAAALRKGLGDPVSVWEDFSAYQVGPLAPDGFRDGPFTLTPPGAMARMPFTPGELSFHARVSVTYRLQ